MRILSTQEQEDFDRPPVFGHTERKQMFSLPKSLLATARTLRTSSSQTGFLLMCGYFRASKRFFLPQGFNGRDIEAAANLLNPCLVSMTSLTISSWIPWEFYP
jgi:hypothetical protein